MDIVKGSKVHGIARQSHRVGRYLTALAGVAVALSLCSGQVASAAGAPSSPAANAPGDLEALGVVDRLPNPGENSAWAADWSPDGVHLAGKDGTNVWVKDLNTGEVWLALDETGRRLDPENSGASVAWSPDGTRFAVPLDCGDADWAAEWKPAPPGVVVVSVLTREVTWVTHDCHSSDLSWSPDGKRLAISSEPLDEFGNVFVAELSKGSIKIVSTSAKGKKGNDYSIEGRWSPDGKRICFTSWASNLIPGDRNGRTGVVRGIDVFVKTLATGAIKRVSTDSRGNEANEGSVACNWSPDGKKIAFSSEASNLVPGDTNNERDVFVKNLKSGAVQRVSTRSSGKQGNNTSEYQQWSPNGKMLAFESFATNLVPGDTNKRGDVFVKNLRTGALTRVSTAVKGVQANRGGYGPVWSPDGRRLAFSSDSTNLGGLEGDIFVKTLR